MGTIDLGGLILAVKMHGNNNELDAVPIGFGTDVVNGSDSERFIGTLRAGQVLEIRGWMSASLEELNRHLSETWTYVATLRLGDIVLDERMFILNP
jgi:hypothetical protein